MSAHTPGPWATDGDYIIERTGYLGGVYIAKEGDGRIGQTFTNCLVKTDEECRANARLIAEAPAMLDALEEINTKVGGLFAAMGHGLEISEQAWDEAFAALGKGREAARKARGEA